MKRWTNNEIKLLGELWQSSLQTSIIAEQFSVSKTSIVRAIIKHYGPEMANQRSQLNCNRKAIENDG